MDEVKFWRGASTDYLDKLGRLWINRKLYVQDISESEHLKVEENKKQTLESGGIVDDCLQKFNNMVLINLELELDNNEKLLLREQFKVEDIDVLSNYEILKLYNLLQEIEIDELCKACENEDGTCTKEMRPLSEYGLMVAGIMRYISTQYIEGGKRFISLAERENLEVKVEGESWYDGYLPW